MSQVLAVVTDLFFQSRIASAARARGHEVQFVRSIDALPLNSAALLALVDLDAKLDVLAAIRGVAGAGIERIVAFGPHVDTAGRKAARAAGAHRVLAKSKFVEELPSILAELAAKREDA